MAPLKTESPRSGCFPDQGEGEPGALIIPNTVALIKDAPHPEEAKALIDFLLSPEVEAMLSQMRSIQIPLNPDVERGENVPNLGEVKVMDADFPAAAAGMEESATFIREVFLK